MAVTQRTMMRVERLQAGNEAQLAAFLPIFADEPAASAQPNFLSNPLNYFLAAYLDNEPAGCLYGYELQQPGSPRPLFFLYSIDVLEPFRRQGLARALIASFSDLCQQRNGAEVFVLSEGDNRPAINLYKSTGGQREGNQTILFVYAFED